MVDIFGRRQTRRALLERVSDMRQLGGIRRLEQTDGPGKGSGIARLETGSGFSFDVLLDRGMDVGAASYRGASLVWLSPAGYAHPARFDDKGIGWLRTFPAGLITTCGLTQTGAACRDGNEELGIHGRYTSLPAGRLSESCAWEGDEYVMRLSGEMREAVLFGENLVLHRTIEARLGFPGLILTDVVTNEGPRPSPHMILYHCNFGYPLLSEASELITSSKRIEPRDSEAAAGLERACCFDPPRAGYREKVYFHHLKADRKGSVLIRLRNPELFGGVTLNMRYRLEELPYFTQWKMLGKTEYVCGLEPGNALVMGRVEERKAGRLAVLQPGERRTYRLELFITTP
ncbi:MAG: aldose 1-epimerase family protein [Candidatus Omnitrophica bacterium]|nr:hypothetical protein [bacterium]NUN97760.1 aldose 1-epimerase family protein [Candidatus Omnitrophota bacterium]